MTIENSPNNQEFSIQDEDVELREYYRALQQDLEEEAKRGDPVYQRCRYVSFVSTSAGVGKKRRPREVNLLVVDNKYAYQVIRGEIKSRVNNNHIAPDVLAVEVLSDVDKDERSTDLLLSRAIRNLKKLY